MKKSVQLEFMFKDLNVAIGSLDILHDVSGVVHSGELLAVMGPSGSGKTTMLNAIAKRIPVQSGEVTLNGKLLDKKLKRRMCYVLQEDSFFSRLTLWETLYFAVMTHLSDSIPKSEKLIRVNRIIEALDLTACKDTVIGDHMQRGLSGGEKKRVSIACELLTDPDIMLLDEPTSGLDAATAYSLMAQLKRYTEEFNKAIIVTIHQPSSRIFHMFTCLLLLAKGNVAFFGEAKNALNFFEEVGLICEPHYNPADFILETTKQNEEAVKKIIDLSNQKRCTTEWPLALRHQEKVVAICESDLTNNSCKTQISKDPFKRANPASLPIEKVSSDCVALSYIQIDSDVAAVSIGNNNIDISPNSHWPTSFWTQFTMLTWRIFKQSRGRILSKYALINTMTIGLALSLVYFQIDRTYSTVRDRMGLLFFVIIHWAFVGVTDAVTSFPMERPVILKERTAGAYRLSAYLLAKMASEVPLTLIMPCLQFTLVYWMAGFRGVAQFFASLGILLLSAFASQGVGFIIGVGVWDLRLAFTCLSSFVLVSLLLGGMYTTKFPPGLFWLRYLSIFCHPFYALSILELSDLEPLLCQDVNDIEFPQCTKNGTEMVTADMIMYNYGIRLPIYCYLMTTFITMVMLRYIAYWVMRIRYTPQRRS